MGRVHLIIGIASPWVEAVQSVPATVRLAGLRVYRHRTAAGSKCRSGAPMTAPPQLVTPRLVLRDWTDDDLPAFAALNADARVMKYFPGTLGRGQSDALAARLRHALVTEGHGLWAVQVSGSADFAGFVGLTRPTFDAHFTPCVEIGWRIAFEHWGQGYATEAARAVAAHAFGPLALQEIVAFTAVANTRSRRVMERLGMRHVPADDFEHPCLPEGHPLRMHVLYRLSRDHWLAMRAGAASDSPGT